MALEDFLGKTSEIKIMDFLAENMDISYNQTEISEFTGLSRTTVNKKISEMIQNNVLEIKEEIGHLRSYQLADNEIVKMLIVVSLKHSFMQAEDKDKGEYD
jgi:DNA-binding MarR family transcriptional regulator